MHTHTGENRFTCEVCENTFTRRDRLVNHIRNHTEEKHFTSDVCEKTFTRKHSLERHMRINMGGNTFTCGICEKTFTKKNSLDRHMEYAHRRILFQMWSMLRRHLRERTDLLATCVSIRDISHVKYVTSTSQLVAHWTNTSVCILDKTCHMCSVWQIIHTK